MKNIAKIGECIRKGLLQITHIRILFNNLGYIFILHRGIRTTVLLGLEKVCTKWRQRIPIGLQFIYLAFGNATKHSGIDIILFGSLRRIHITGNIEVISIPPDFVTAYRARKARNRRTLTNGIGNALYVAGTESIVLAFLDKSFGSIDNKHIVTIPMLLQDHNQCGNTCSKKDVSRQPDNGIYIISLNKIPTDFPFSFAICVHIATEKYSMRQYDGENAIGFEVMQFVK